MGYGWHGLVWLQSSNKLSRKVSALVWISGCVPSKPADYSCCPTTAGPDLWVELDSILLDLLQYVPSTCLLHSVLLLLLCHACLLPTYWSGV